MGNPPQRKKNYEILGVSWKIDCDKFLFDFKEIIEEPLSYDVIIKRVVLKVISSVFDPFGILSPIVINLKLLFQDLCLMKIDWDVSLAIEFVNKWEKKFYLKVLKQI